MVYVGESKKYHEEHNPARWYSQVKQDEVVAGLFRGMRDGYFLDLAANDATFISNTYALERYYSWNGVCVEANPFYWYNLTHIRNCQVIGGVVGAQFNDVVHFNYINKDGHLGGFSGIVGDGFDNKANKISLATREYTVPLAEVLNSQNAPNVIDYMSLDVEGAETYIMRNFPFDRYKIKVITIERPKPDLRAIMIREGYEELVPNLSRWGETVWVNTLYKSSLDLDSLKGFNFPVK